MWALAVGEDLYEIRNSPFYAYGINFGDIVRAHSDDQGLKPEVREVVRPSGNRTLRVFFNETIDEHEQRTLLSSLKSLNVSWERATKRLVAIDVHPEADYQTVCDKLWSLEQQEILAYETCEARVPGSFDDKASEDDE